MPRKIESLHLKNQRVAEQSKRQTESKNAYNYGSVKTSVQDHAWLALRDGNISPEDLREVLRLTAALTRLNIDPVYILRQGQGVQGANAVCVEVEKLKKLWNDQIEMDVNEV